MIINVRQVTTYKYDLLDIEDVQLLHDVICLYQDHIHRSDILDPSGRKAEILARWSGALYDFFRGDSDDD